MPIEQNTANVGNKKTYPETFKLAEGEHSVMMMIEFRPGIQTGYGIRNVAEVVLRGDESKPRTFWWPKRLNVPQLLTPFYIKHTDKFNYSLVIASTDDEARALWATGAFPAPVAGAGGGNPLAAVLQKLNTPRPA